MNFSIPSPPSYIPETKELDLAMLSFLRSEILMGSKHGLHFDHHMQVATEMQLK